MKCKLLLILLFLASVAQGQSSYFRFVASSVSASSAINLQNSGSIYHQISFTKSGTVLTCTVAVDSSADGISWSAGAIITGQTCTSNGDSLPQTHVVANYMRVNVTAISGGGSVTVVYTGYTTPTSAGGTVTSVTASPPITSTGGNTPNIACPTCGTGTGTVTSFSAGTLSPLFTTSVATATTTPALSFSLTNAAGGTVFGNNTTASAGPAFTAAPVIGIPGTSTGTIALASSTASGKYTITAPANAATPTLTLPTGSGTVAVSATSPVTVNATSGDVGCATCTTNAAALTLNAVVLGGGSQASKVDTALSTDAAGAVTDTQGTITTSKPLMSHTVTWNAGGVAFTNWLSNITCTAAATASIAAGFGTAGTQWQFKYNAANCGAPQLLLPDGTATNPAWAFGTDTQLGLFRASSGILALSNGSAAQIIRIANSGLYENSSAGGFIWNSAATGFGGSFDSGVFRAAAGVVEISNTSSANRSGLLLSGNSVFVTGNFTTSGVGTALENITGLTWTFPATALNYNFHCHIGYSQAVGTAAVAFGIKATTNNPTNIFATGEMYTAAGTVTTGVLATLATTTATNIVTGTPGGTGTNLPVDLYGTLELPASAVTINLMTSTATAADTVTVLRGSYCSLTP